MVPPVYRPRAAGRERWTFVDGGGSGARPALSEGQWADVWAELHRAAQDGRQYVFVHGHWFRVPPVQTDAPEAREGVPKAELQVRQNIDELNYVNEDEGSGRSVDVPLPRPDLRPGSPSTTTRPRGCGGSLATRAGMKARPTMGCSPTTWGWGRPFRCSR